SVGRQFEPVTAHQKNQAFRPVLRNWLFCCPEFMTYLVKPPHGRHQLNLFQAVGRQVAYRLLGAPKSCGLLSYLIEGDRDWINAAVAKARVDILSALMRGIYGG